MKKTVFIIPLLILSLVMIIFVAGCIGQTTGENLGKENATKNASEQTYAGDNINTNKQNTSSYEELNKTSENTTPKNDTITPRLISWIKESGIRIPNGISSSTIFRDGKYWMYYTGNGIELAISNNGIGFELKGNVIRGEGFGSEQEMVTNPAVFVTKDNKYRMIYEGAKIATDEKGGFYQFDRKLYSAISTDGETWTKEDGVRFWDYGDGKPGEIFTSVPDVIRLSDGRLRMYYTKGITSAIAVSNDDGITWTKEGKIVVPSATGGMITDPDVIKIENGYRMYYSEFRSNGQGSDILSAFSSG